MLGCFEDAADNVDYAGVGFLCKGSAGAVSLLPGVDR